MLGNEDQIISEFLSSIGPWSKNVIIGGGYALIIYKLYLANDDSQNYPVGTRDIDTLLSRKIAKVTEKNIGNHLREAGFTPIFKDLDLPATEAYVKEINGLEIEIEFLTDSAVRKDKYKNVRLAGVVAQPLSYLSLSLQSTKGFQTSTGESGLVVTPGAWMFHKGLTFSKRRTLSKKCKDLYGIWYVASQLGDFSKRAVDEIHLLELKHLKWYKTFQKNLRDWIENATPQDWMHLEAQDPVGDLTKANFIWMINRIVQIGVHV
ncbi:MAG: GSU2403 family nucleotidyltransferase fold protein [Simkaniaceae bacterium]|nr:GSU2403 family nucleotidyltransferase fold protein [Candidatus Sacchlamyda saccharinae]